MLRKEVPFLVRKHQIEWYYFLPVTKVVLAPLVCFRIRRQHAYDEWMVIAINFILNVCSIAKRFFWMNTICCRIICVRRAVMELVSRLFLSDNRFSQTLLLKHFARPFFLPWPLKICSRCLGSISFYSATAKECLQTLSALKLGHRHDTWLAWTAHSTLPCLAEFEATSNLFWLFMKCHSNEFPETLNTKPIMQALSCVFCCGKNVIAFFDSLNIFALR